MEDALLSAGKGVVGGGVVTGRCPEVLCAASAMAAANKNTRCMGVLYFGKRNLNLGR